MTLFPLNTIPALVFDLLFGQRICIDREKPNLLFFFILFFLSTSYDHQLLLKTHIVSLKRSMETTMLLLFKDIVYVIVFVIVFVIPLYFIFPLFLSVQFFLLLQIYEFFLAYS